MTISRLCTKEKDLIFTLIRWIDGYIVNVLGFSFIFFLINEKKLIKKQKFVLLQDYV